LLVALSLSGCLKEDAWCPVMYVSFELEDESLPGDFDSRVGHDVLLYIFRDDILTYSHLIPYDSIANRAEYAIEKTPAITGNLKMVAWAVPDDIIDHHHNGEALNIHNARHREYDLGSRFDQHFLNASAIDDDHHAPIHHERYIGTPDLIGDEPMSRDSHVDIVMRPATGRIIVNITDPNNYLGKTNGEPHVVVDGTMSQMNLSKQGVGEQVRVRTGIGETSPATRAAEGTTHTTEIFGVMPSEPGRTLNVNIMNGTELVETLSVRTDERRHQAIESGELLEFDYVIGSGAFNLTIEGWTERIVIDNKTGL
jgi:hypothetical protein